MSPVQALSLRGQLSGRVLLAAALAAVFGGAAYLVASNWASWFPKSEFEAAAALECDPSTTPCSAQFGPGASISLALAPRPLRAAEPMRVSIRSTGLDGRQAWVTFSGVEMNMGLTTVELDGIGAGRFQGVATLPLCISRRMTWRARVSVSAPDADYHADFHFDTSRH
jgi:hypothetical protein